MDKDGDGIVTQEEEIFYKMDKDGDGTVANEEKLLYRMDKGTRECFRRADSPLSSSLLLLPLPLASRADTRFDHCSRPYSRQMEMASSRRRRSSYTWTRTATES